ncbi:MAG: aspartate aminotransferase family protein [Dehalococcoidia bacterium]|nr:aspartate aminotransferase family protein [Dehalococcoidia bacterium]
MPTDWKEMESRYYMRVVRRQPVVLVRGQGTRVWDEDGKEYLDFTGGWAVNNLGHCHPTVTEAIVQQARTLLQTSNIYYTIPQLQLAQLLVEQSCLDRVFFCNSGAEANEGAVKLARKYGRLHLKGAYEVITALNSFHGRTLAMVAATGQPHYQENFRPLPVGFVNVEFDSIEAIKRSTTENTCAVLLEPVQGEGGVNVPSPSYLKEVRAWCDERGILLMLDEIQTGMGRLGTLFGYQQFGVEPDVITLAKGLGNGVPIGAFLAKERAAVFEPGDHGSTFGGNVLTCAAAYAAAKVIVEENIPAKAEATGKYLHGRLSAMKERYDFITDVRGMGLLLAMEFRDTLSATIVGACNQEGLLLNAVRPNALRFMPPLTTSLAEVDEAVARLDQVLTRVGRETGARA